MESPGDKARFDAAGLKKEVGAFASTSAGVAGPSMALKSGKEGDSSRFF